MDVNAIQLRSALETATHADPAAVSHGAAERFQALMQVDPTAPADHVDHGQGNPIAAIARAQDQAIARVANDALWLGANMQSMSLDRLLAATTLVQVQTASLTIDMQVKMATVTASKDAISTLMKNQ